MTPRSRRARRGRNAFVRPLRRRARRMFRALASAPLSLQLLMAAAIVVLLWAAVNWVYQAARKPSEVLFPVSSAFAKTPSQTWREYGALFREHSTAVITPELLAALAQAEGAGNPVARTYWRWRVSSNPFGVYRPASSAVGMYQITDATFAQARRYCIHDHAVVEAGRWDDFHSCWFNGLYNRLVPSHAVEMTAAFLDRSVIDTLARRRITSATPQQKQDLAAVIHLCGAAAGEAYARRGFRPAAGQRCGDHDLRAYLARLNALKREFVRISAI